MEVYTNVAAIVTAFISRTDSDLCSEVISFLVGRH